MWTPRSCISEAYSSHSRSRSVRPCMRARLVEEGEREPRDLLRVHRVVVAALGQLDRAAPPDVGNAIRLRDLLACGAGRSRAPALREARGRRASAPRRRAGAGSCRAGPRRRRRGRRAGDRGRASSAAARGRFRRPPCGRGESAWPTPAGCEAPPAAEPRASVAATVPRLRMVPDVPMTRSKPIAAICSQCRSISSSTCLSSRRSSRSEIGSRLDEALGQPDDADLEAARQLDRRCRCRA